MIPPDGQPILTAAAMRAAEAAAMARGVAVDDLMERAGRGVAEAVRRLGGGAPVLVLCGPSNNGGDGYIAARLLAEWGLSVRVAAYGEPKSGAAQRARQGWTGPVETLAAATGDGAVVIDAVFGTGLRRALDTEVAAAIDRLVGEARFAVALDVPSGVGSDDGGDLLTDRGAAFDLTLALGALKPAHLLQPAATVCGAVRVIGIGVAASGPVAMVDRPALVRPGPRSHKYNRGMVAVVSGQMHGASELAARAAYRAGAGYVLLLTGGLPRPPLATVRKGWDGEALNDARIGAVVIGPGLGRDDRARGKLDAALASGRTLVIDGDALHLLDLDRLAERRAPAILTPHAGEFDALFGKDGGSKIDRALAAATRAQAVVVFKGPDTVIASPDGRAQVAGEASPWLSVAGTGDVLAGTVGAMLAQRPDDPFAAACAAVWLHGEAARLLPGPFLADELTEALSYAIARAR